MKYIHRKLNFAKKQLSIKSIGDTLSARKKLPKRNEGIHMLDFLNQFAEQLQPRQKIKQNVACACSCCAPGDPIPQCGYYGCNEG